MTRDIDVFAQVAEKMLSASRPIARDNFRSRLLVERKSDQSPVTRADRMIETAMKAVLERALPTHGILGEEHGAHGLDTRYVWVIDPIDGTKSFISGVPLFGTLIALLDHGVPILGVIDMPMLGECWNAQTGHGAFFGQEKCQTRAVTKLEDAILFATSPDQFKGTDIAIFDHLAKSCVDRRFGGDCYSYGLLASGHIDLILEADLQPYDFMALVPVVTEAGGVITDWEGNALTLSSSGRVLAAATPELHQMALAKITDIRRSLENKVA